MRLPGLQSLRNSPYRPSKITAPRIFLLYIKLFYLFISLFVCISYGLWSLLKTNIIENKLIYLCESLWMRYEISIPLLLSFHSLPPCPRMKSFISAGCYGINAEFFFVLVCSFLLCRMPFRNRMHRKCKRTQCLVFQCFIIRRKFSIVKDFFPDHSLRLSYSPYQNISNLQDAASLLLSR